MAVQPAIASSAWRLTIECLPSTYPPMLAFRIGINLGEVIIEGDDIYGDGVNVAARLQEVAERGGIYLSGTLFEQVDGKVDLNFVDMGNQQFKNIAKPIRVYRVNLIDISSTVEQRLFFDMSSQKKEPVIGGCSCGAVRYEITEPAIDVGYCHCRMCQRFTGSLFSCIRGVPDRVSPVHARRTEPYFHSSEIAERGFCANCGSSLTFKPSISQWSDWFVVTIGSLDHPENFKPAWHTGIESQMPWLNIHDDLPRVRSLDSPDLVDAWASVGQSVPEPNLR